MELRAKIRELVKAGRVQSIPARVRASSKKASPRQERMPMDEEQAASAAAVFQSIAGVELEESSKSGPPGAPGKTFDELYEWYVDDDGISYEEKGPATFEKYLSKVYWSQTEAGGATGYQDPGWLRTCPVPSAAQLTDARGRKHMYSNHNSKVPVGCELRGISVTDLRHYLGIPVGRRGGFRRGTAEHARARCISGCLRHSGSLIPAVDTFHSMRNGLGCAMDSGEWFFIDDFLNVVNRYVYPELRQDTPPLSVSQLAYLASDGTEDMTKMRWQFSVLVRTSRGGRRNDTW